MTLDTEILRQQLRELEEIAGKPSRYIIAFSGGLDSTVLLHALVSLREELGLPLLAIHVDHGLQEDSGAWSEHCREVARELGVECRCRAVTVQLESGKGPEASARDARYTALHGELSYNDWLLSAHHREDQAETLLLNLIRGSGLAGMAGIGAIRRFGPGWLARPLLETSRAALLEYANSKALHWLDDPSNADRRFDRNFLRHEVLPRLKSRWPDVSARLHRSAKHAGEAAELLAKLAEIDLDSLGGRAQRLPIDGLLELRTARQKNLLRHALRRLGLSTPTAIQLTRILEEVIPAREDAQPLVTWPGASVRRYRNKLYLLPEELAESPRSVNVSADEVPLGNGLGVLQFVRGARRGLSERFLEREIQVRFRQGGEEFQPADQLHTRKLKKLLQEEGVVPWMRDRLPLVYADNELIAVGDLWMAASAISEPGVGVCWKDRPALH
ncbi:MAG: tRNA lysidine(34) synthetase TilS [Gammaproteobacteria bacterium]|nr:tRNA lysidine(34) synthetase TilS [Gammaproteobacteria bacterium]